MTDVNDYGIRDLAKDAEYNRRLSKKSPFSGSFHVSCVYHKYGSQWSSGWHTGIDLVADTSDKNVYAVMGGYVLAAGYGTAGDLHGSAYGNHVVIKNNDGSLALYAHMQYPLYVTTGQTVTAGELLGIMGGTGSKSMTQSTFAPHLHLEYHPSGVYKYNSNDADPAPWLGLPSGYKVGESIASNTLASTAAPSFANLYDSSVTRGVAEYVYQEELQNAMIRQQNEDALALLLSSGYEYNASGGVSYGDILYGRRYRIIVVKNDGKAIELSQLRCTFDIQKTFFIQPNLSNVKVYNLAADAENEIIKNGQRIVVEAGYEGVNYGKIFDGYIFQSVRYKENATDYVLEITALDGDRFVTAGFVKQSLVAGQTLRDEVECITRYSSVPINMGSISDKFNTNGLPRAKVLFGSSSQYMNQIAKTTQTAFSVQDGYGEFNDLQGAANEIIELSPETGLLGFPAQIQQGISVECLLNPRITIGTAFHIDNSRIQAEIYDTGDITATTVRRLLDQNGIYKVYQLTHSGDTRGDEWSTKIEAISQLGLLPALGTEANSNVV